MPKFPDSPDTVRKNAVREVAVREHTASIELFPGSDATFSPQIQLWLSGPQDHGFGYGRMQLFRLIDELGSLSKAARALGMSYRAAWGKIKEMEQITGMALVCSQGSKREGYSLTPQGRALMKAIACWFDDVQAYAVARAQLYFPVKTDKEHHS